jgi:hypothetical protein
MPETDEPSKKERRNNAWTAKYEAEAQDWIYRLPMPPSLQAANRTPVDLAW